MKGSTATSTKSVRAAKKKLQDFLRTCDTYPKQIIEQEVPIILAEAKARTPYKSGKLRASVYVRASKDMRRKFGIVAGASAIEDGYNYAGIQHENKAFHHQVGADHYISVPYERGIKRIKLKVRREFNRKLRGK